MTITAEEFVAMDVRKSVHFKEAVLCKVPNTDIEYFRVPMHVAHPVTGKLGSFAVSLPGTLFSTGIDLRSPPGDQSVPPKISKAQISLCMHSRPDPTDLEIRWIAKYHEVVDMCKDHVVLNAKGLRRRGFVKTQMGKEFSPLSIPTLRDPKDKKIELEDENGNTIVDTSKRPFFNPELIIKKISATDVTILTNFYEMDDVDENGKRIRIDPIELVNRENDRKKFNFSGAIEFDHIYVGGSVVSMKVRIPDGYVSRQESRDVVSEVPEHLASRMATSGASSASADGSPPAKRQRVDATPEMPPSLPPTTASPAPISASSSAAVTLHDAGAGASEDAGATSDHEGSIAGSDGGGVGSAEMNVSTTTVLTSATADAPVSASAPKKPLTKPRSAAAALKK